MDVATIYNDGIPDRPIYSHWDSILEKHSPHATGYPWKAPAYQGNVEYSKDMCPRSLDILGPALRFNMDISEGHARLMARALNKVDAALGG